MVIVLPSTSAVLIDSFGCVLLTFSVDFESAFSVGLKINNINQK